MDNPTGRHYRIGARVPPDVYEALNRAAGLNGATVNQFLVQAAMKEAQTIIEREQTVRLSRRDCEQLLDLLDDPPRTKGKLKAALKNANRDADPEDDDDHHDRSAD